jgi:hypothetical protein
MIKVIKAVAIGVVCFGIGFSDTRWQTTRNGTSSGYCGLTSNKITVTVHPYYADVVEEAEITTSGNVWNGDSKTLEISGTFKLSEGTALRSLLLWNGNKILKGKLLLRDDADSAYENVVNRVVVRDPALIHYMGNNQYQFKIFPVEINNSRKIRILYTVPLQMSNDGLQFKISTAFTSGTEQTPDQIPVEILKSNDAISPYIIQHGSIKKTVQFGATYSIPVFDFQEFYSYNYRTGNSKPVTITPSVKSWNIAYKKDIDSSNTKGSYVAIFASLPDTIPAFIDEENLNTKNISIEAKITAGQKVYLSDMPGRHYFSAYIKSSTPWDSMISWTCYNNTTGEEIFKFSQKIICASDSLNNSMVPFIWGAKYSLKEGTGALGAQFGFVDSKMSLLALEKDSLTRSLAIQYQDEGVPVLNPEEIVIKASKMPIAPKENAIFEYDVSTLKQMTAAKSFNIMYANGIIQIQFPNQLKGAMKGFIIDASGKVVYKFTDISKMGCTFNFKVPNGLKGLYIVKIQTGGENMQKKIMVY